ncbi:hypothetical protein [Kribbella antiqua]|uniref:hypothetical protein n=1 Tax=Kribbella antiqua TaxID=2512217 RepID=UPI001053B6F1|nr:hypothetical protein [Kribbella antiqua]
MNLNGSEGRGGQRVFRGYDEICGRTLVRRAAAASGGVESGADGDLLLRMPRVAAVVGTMDGGRDRQPLIKRRDRRVRCRAQP